jgi:hypothetical protein
LQGPREVPQTYEKITHGGPITRRSSTRQALGPPCAVVQIAACCRWRQGKGVSKLQKPRQHPTLGVSCAALAREAPNMLGENGQCYKFLHPLVQASAIICWRTPPTASICNDTVAKRPATAPTRGEQTTTPRFARRETGCGFGICAPRALEIKSRFSFWSTTMRFREQLRWGHHGGGTKVASGPAKVQPVYYRRIIENPPSLTLLGEFTPPPSVYNLAYGCVVWGPSTKSQF